MYLKKFKLIKLNGKREYTCLIAMLLGSVICVFSTMFFMRVIKTTQFSAQHDNIEETEYTTEFTNPTGQTVIDWQLFVEVQNYISVEIRYDNISLSGASTRVCRKNGITDGTILLSTNLLSKDNYSVGQSYEFLGNEYIIAGRSGSYDTLYVPLADDVLDNRACSSVNLITGTPLNKSSLAKLVDSTGLIARSSGEVNIDSNFWSGLMYMAISTALCLYSIYLVFEYSLKLKRSKYIACALSGANLRSLEGLVLTDGLMPVLTGSALGVILNILLYKVQQKAFEEAVKLNFWNVLICVGLVMTVSLIILVFKLLKMRKRNYYSNALKL